MTNKIYTFLFIIVLCACKTKKEKDFEYAGGTFRMAIDVDISTQTPHNVYDYYSEIVLNQVFEGLVSMDEENLQIRPQLARSYKVSRDGLVYEFKLRDDVYFHPHESFKDEESRKFTPEDVVHSFQMICKKNDRQLPSAGYSSLFENKVMGANLFHEGKRDSITGISVKGNTLKIHLITPDASFLHKLATINASITSKKLYQAGYGSAPVGTGPFIFSGYEEKENKTIILKKNELYYQLDAAKNRLPYLDELHFLIEPSKKQQLALFEDRKTDFILSLPPEGIHAILEGRINDFNAVPPILILRSNPLMATNYYFFNMTEPRFQNVKVRKAISYAINRQEISSRILHNQVLISGSYGLVPPLPEHFKNYDFQTVQKYAYSYQPETARKLLLEAGYKKGSDFGEIRLVINDSELNTAVAREVAQQLKKELDLSVIIEAVDFETFNHKADSAKGDLFRAAWFADFASPESFLQNFYGQHVPNTINEISSINQSRYKNYMFDEYFETARDEKRISTQTRYFNLAEIELMKNPPLIVLWYSEDNQVLYSYIRNLKENPINYFNFKEVYLLEASKEEYHK